MTVLYDLLIVEQITHCISVVGADHKLSVLYCSYNHSALTRPSVQVCFCNAKKLLAVLVYYLILEVLVSFSVYSFQPV